MTKRSHLCSRECFGCLLYLCNPCLVPDLAKKFVWRFFSLSTFWVILKVRLWPSAALSTNSYNSFAEIRFVHNGFLQIALIEFHDSLRHLMLRTNFTQLQQLWHLLIISWHCWSGWWSSQSNFSMILFPSNCEHSNNVSHAGPSSNVSFHSTCSLRSNIIQQQHPEIWKQHYSGRCCCPFSVSIILPGKNLTPIKLIRASEYEVQR